MCTGVLKHFNDNKTYCIGIQENWKNFDDVNSFMIIHVKIGYPVNFT